MKQIILDGFLALESGSNHSRLMYVRSHDLHNWYIRYWGQPYYDHNLYFSPSSINSLVVIKAQWHLKFAGPRPISHSSSQPTLPPKIFTCSTPHPQILQAMLYIIAIYVLGVSERYIMMCRQGCTCMHVWINFFSWFQTCAPVPYTCIFLLFTVKDCTHVSFTSYMPCHRQ